MALAIVITSQVVIARSGLTLLARIRGNAGALAVIADFSAIAYNVRDLTNAYNVASGNLTPAAVLFNGLQLDSLWTKDAVGYNFKATLPASALSGIGPKMQVDVKFTPADGSAAFIVPFQFPLQPTYV